MKNLIYTGIFLLGLIMFQACIEKELELPSFKVETLKTTYQVGENIEFVFSGNPNMITFYSGQQGIKYENRNRTIADGTPTLQFNTVKANGTQTSSLHIMVSNDFEGMVDDDANTIENIAKATWVDITSRATLSPGANTSSGAIDLSDFADMGKPVYIAFKYTAEAGSTQPKWTVSNLTVTNTLEDMTVYTLANLTTNAIANYGNSNLFGPGWYSVNVSNTYKWTVGSTLVITGATSNAAATASAEAWVFSGPIDLRKVTHDLGIIVKDMTTKAGTYSYNYNAPGTYIATFVGSNTSVYGVVEKLDEIQLTINQ